jgi:hypothetical protein
LKRGGDDVKELATLQIGTSSTQRTGITRPLRRIKKLGHKKERRKSTELRI